MSNFTAANATTLLLVEDDIAQLELCALALEISGFAVLTAAGPVEAILMMGRNRPAQIDVAVLDYEMPVMNGCMLADDLRTRFPNLKIILHSGADDIPETEMASVDAYVPKGHGMAQLIEQVAALAEVSGRASPSRVA